MIQDLLITLFTDLVVGPIQADILAKFAAERAPPEIAAQVTACMTDAPRTLAQRAMADPVWGVSSAVSVWTQTTTAENVLRQAVPGCGPALDAAKPYLAELGV